MVHEPVPPADQLSEEALVKRYLHGSGNSDTRGNGIQLFLTEEEYRNNGLQRGRPVSAPTDPDVHKREPNNSADPYFLSENEYRIYGLRGPQQVMTTNAVVRESGSDLRGPHQVMTSNAVVRESRNDPYDESTSTLVNRYLGMPPMKTGVQAEPYPVSNERAYASYNLGEQSVLNQRSYSLNASREQLEFNAGARLHDSTSAPVSNRYSFAGPPLLERR